MSNSSLYVGQVRHRRLSPRSHNFSYRLFYVYLDLSEIETIFDRFWFWSIDRANIASFRRREHLGDSNTSLDQSVRDHIEKQTGRRPTGAIRLLTHLRYFGFGFNPVSFYYCYDDNDENIEFIVAEVNNTPWGEQYCYVLDSHDDISGEHTSSGKIQRYLEDKRFHVSPFMPMDMQYDWRFSTPEKTLSVHMENHQHGTKIFDATLTLQRREINSKNLATALTLFPLITIKVVTAIYYQALLLLLKKTPLFNHPKHEAPKPVKPT